MLVRPAKREDIDKIIDMVYSMLNESVYAFLPFDREKVRRGIIAFIEKPDKYCFFVAEEGKILSGILGGYLTDYYFCQEKLACDSVLFVKPEYRGSSAAMKLVRTFRDWAASRKAREVCLGVSSGVNLERTNRFYEKMGFTRVGGVYKQRL